VLAKGFVSISGGLLAGVRPPDPKKVAHLLDRMPTKDSFDIEALELRRHIGYNHSMQHFDEVFADSLAYLDPGDVILIRRQIHYAVRSPRIVATPKGVRSGNIGIFDH